MGEKSLTTEEIAKRLKVSKLTVYDLIKKEKIPSYRVGRQVRVDEEDLLAYIQKSKHRGILESKIVMSPLTSETSVFSNDALVISGQDISLDIFARYLLEQKPGRPVLRAHIGSLSSLMDLYREMDGIASLHLYDGDTGVYNIPYVKKILVGLPCIVFRFLIREVGFYVKKGNPKHILSWQDLKRSDIRFVNRERGAGIRVLVDEKLRIYGISPSEINGYQTLAQNHTGIAAMVAFGEADVGVGIKSVALLTDLDFISLQKEHYDLVLLKKTNHIDFIEKIQAVLQNKKFQEELALIGNYDLTDIGKIIYETNM